MSTDAITKITDPINGSTDRPTPASRSTAAPQPPSQGPRCGHCQGATVRAGTCYVCLSCGTTTGCS